MLRQILPQGRHRLGFRTEDAGFLLGFFSVGCQPATFIDVLRQADSLRYVVPSIVADARQAVKLFHRSMDFRGDAPPMADGSLLWIRRLWPTPVDVGRIEPRANLAPMNPLVHPA